MNTFIYRLFLKSGTNATHLLLLAIMCFLHTAVAAQNRQLDSLDRLVATAKTDTDRIRLNIKKIVILGRKSLDTAIYLDKIELQKAEKANFYDGIFILHTQLVNNYIFKGNYDSAKANILYMEKMVRPADSSGIASIYAAYGMMYGVQAIYDSSIKFYEKAIPINERLNHEKELTSNYANIAIGYQQLANFPRALEYQQRSLKLSEDNNNEELQAKTLLNIGNTYDEMGDAEKAEKYFLKAKDIAVKNEYKIIELYDYTNLSSMYITNRNWTKAYEYAMKAADLSVSTGDIGIKGASLAKAATAMAHQNKFAEATILSKQAIHLADSSTQPLNISQAYQALAITFFLQKKYTEAIPYYEKSLQVLKGDLNYDAAVAGSYKDLSECYEKTGDNAKALANYKMSAEITDSIKRKDNIRKATELGMNYDFAKKQEVLNAEKKRDDEVAKTKQRALFVGLLLVLTLAIVAFRGYRNKQKANHLITQQKQQVETTLSELKAAQAQLIQSEKMASLGELTAGIAHEIQNPLNFVNNFSEINKELIEELKIKNAKLKIEDEEVNELLNDIKANEEKINFHGKRADAIVKGMLQHSRKDAGVKEPTDINALCDEYVRLSFHGLRAKDKNFQADYKTDFDTDISKVNIVSQDVGRVLLNLFNNSFYSVNERLRQAQSDSHYKPTVSVRTRKTENSVTISVSDNGNGIPQAIVDKIFQPFFTTKPTGQGTGLGLSLSYDIVKAHGGEMKVESKEGEGTEFIIMLPV